jgi:hypothetical protein
MRRDIDYSWFSFLDLKIEVRNKKTEVRIKNHA